MITPMRHVTLLCREEDRDELLQRLRDAGVVHLHLERHLNHDLEREEEALATAARLVQKLENLPPADGADPEDMEPEDIVEEILCRETGLRDLVTVDAKLAREEKFWEPFGTISLQSLEELRSAGVQVAFYRTPSGRGPDHAADTTWIPARDGYGIGIAVGGEPRVEAEPLHAPVRGPRSLKHRRARLADMARRHHLAIARHSAALPRLRAHRDQLRERLELDRARLGMNGEEGLLWIQGFAPTEQLDRVQAAAKSAGAAISAREPEEYDPVPTLLQQNAVVSWIQPVFQFLGVTPGYREVDVGWSFLVFLTIFSGMIIGDAGYGLLLLVVLGILNLRKPATRGKFANLLYLMGGATVLWGLLSGNVFGIDPLPAPLASLSVPALADPDNPLPIMHVCFVLGAVHLTLAHAWNAWRKRTTLQALAELGWIGSTWTMFFVTGLMVLGNPLPAWVLPVFAVSLVLILLFMTPPSKLKEEWVQHMMLPLSLVNNFVDVVSYVRLYAVGMATFALASSFNEMIFGGDAQRGVIATGLMLVILVLGHGLNFILAGMGVMVHGIRLNTLEFASHIGLTWSGIPYTPFQKTVNEPSTPDS